MKTSDNIKKLFKNTKIKTNKNTDKLVLEDAIKAMSENKKTVPERPHTWRMIMQSKTTKLSIAALLILGFFFGMNYLKIQPDGSSVAWASLAERVKQAKTVKYRIHGITNMPDGKTQDSLVEVKTSSKYGIQMDIFNNGKLEQQMYTLYADQTQTTIMPQIKKYMQLKLNDEFLDTIAKQSYDPKEMVAGFLTADYVKLGKKEIDGVTVEGIETQNANITGVPLEDVKSQLWVDVSTNLPVRIEIEMERKADDASFSAKIIIDNFQWNVEIANSQFVCTIPADFKLAGKAIVPELNAKNAIECLALIAKVNDGKYPSSLNIEKCGREISSIINEKNLEFGMDEQAKIYSLCSFYSQLVREKKDPKYYGDRITSSEPDKILMRWQNEKGGYTVIFADLSKGNFSAEETFKMEAKLPNTLELSE